MWHSATLTRNVSSDEGTFGQLVLDDGTKYYSGELPWRDNKPDISCIPEGEYICQWTRSNRLSLLRNHDVYTYQVMNVPGHEGIRIHSANFCGDKDKGYKSELKGCIAIGLNCGKITIPDTSEVQTGIIASAIAVSDMAANLKKEPFKLIIRGATDGSNEEAA